MRGRYACSNILLSLSSIELKRKLASYAASILFYKNFYNNNLNLFIELFYISFSAHTLSAALAASGITGATIKIDGNGDSEGNFSVLAFKPADMTRENLSCPFQMVPVGYFHQGDDIPVSEFVCLCIT